MPTSALHYQNQLSVTRFESRLESLDRWGHGSSNNARFLRRRPRNGWKKRGLESCLPALARPQPRPVEVEPSMLRQSVEVGLFGTYLIIFLACLWMLG